MTTNRLKECLWEVRVARAAGLDAEAIAARLHERGFSTVTTVKGLRTGLGVSLGEAKEIVYTSPAWAAEVEASQAVRSEALRALEELED